MPVIFGNIRVRSTMAAACCVEPLVALRITDFSPAQRSAVRALKKLLDDEQLADLITGHGVVILLISILFGRNYMLLEEVFRALVKLGRDTTSCKMEMVKASVIKSILNILYEVPDFLSAAYAELLQFLTNNADIVNSSSTANVMDLFKLLIKLEIVVDGQHSALQVLVNILEQLRCRADYSLTPHQGFEPVFALLDSPTQVVQQLAAECLSHLLLEKDLQKDPIM